MTDILTLDGRSLTVAAVALPVYAVTIVATMLLAAIFFTGAVQAQMLLYPLLLGSVGRGAVFGQGVVLRHPAKIRIGSGGVMLPHYSPLKVAETFRVLHALFPGRIDLGIGRAPGSDRLTAMALNPNPQSVDDFPIQVQELGLWLRGEPLPPGRIYNSNRFVLRGLLDEVRQARLLLCQLVEHFLALIGIAQ